MSRNPDAADIFDAARRLPAGAVREAFLEEACSGDAGLRAKIDVLLKADTEADGFLVEPDATATRSEVGEAAGQVIDRYELVERIGEGGFGTVWMAEQREPVVRRVALKIIKLGMDTRQVIARFEAERQALAMMDHPGISKVFDAGTSEAGRPYFVMELVAGVPMLEYCDAEELAMRDRLVLFARVCHAIQHAHQKGIIHRDIKPTNVLVTVRDGEPRPVVIDFGIAKATDQELTQRTLFTAHHQIVGTPAYMSPEQAGMSGSDVDTRSDVYSLGVLLYELLTGTTPFDTRSLLERGYDAMMHAIREEEPRRPSTRISTLGETAEAAAARRRTDVEGLGSSLRGDLDWIAMKCLEKARSRRYDTASALAADVQRHLDDEPVSACPPSWRYRLQKIVKRHRVVVTTALVVAVALVLGMIGTTGGMVLAFEQTARAESAEEEMEREREAAFSHAYRAALAAASLSFQNSEFRKGKALLAKVAPDRRDWIWRVLDARADTPLFAFEGTSLAWVGPSRLRTVTERGVDEFDFAADARQQLCEARTTGPSRVRLTPDGALAVVEGLGPQNGRWRVLDAGSGSTLARIAADGPAPHASYGNHRLAYASGGNLVIHDLRTGAERSRRPTEPGFAPLAWSPDGRMLAAISDELGLHVLDAETLERLPGFDSDRTQADHAVFDPGGRWLASARRGEASGPDTPTEIALCDAATGRRVADRETQIPGRFQDLAVSEGGRRVAVATTLGTVLLDPVTCRIERAFVRRGAVPAFDPDGTMIAVSDRRGRGLVWSVADAAVLVGHRSFVYPVAWSPDGTRLVSGGWDGKQADAPGCIRVWDAATGAPVAAWGERGSSITSLAFTSDGTRFVTCGHAVRKRTHPIRIWDAQTGALVQQIDGTFARCSVAPDGRTLAAIDEDSLVLIDTATLARREGPPRSQDSAHPVPAFSPDGRRVATARHDHSVAVCDVESLEPVDLVGHTGFVHSITFDADGERLLTCGADQQLRIWDPDDGTELAVLEGPRSDVLCAIFAPDGEHVISGHRDGRIRYWHIADREVVAELTGHLDYVFSLALAPDGETIASGSGDGTVRLWGTVPPAGLRRGARDRRARVAELEPTVTRLFDELADPAAVIERLRSELTGRRLEVALQAALAEAVRRRE